MKRKTRFAAASILAALLCASTAHSQSGRQANAIWIRDSAKVVNLTYHPSGISASASTARANIVDTAKCQRAQTSWYSDVGTTYVWLHSGMLSTIKTLAQTYGYSMVVTEYAGGDHSSTSYHYRGTAFDVSSINGRGVSSSNPYWRTFNQRCRDRGAVESLGPGYPGHSTHVHNAWPSGTSASSAGGCITEVAKPTNLNATTIDHDSIKLTWTDNAVNESNFTVQRSKTSNTGPWTTIATLGANSQSYTANGLSAATKYWFRVRAYNSNDNSPWSNVDNATTKQVKPAAPSGLTAVAQNDDVIKLAWTDNSNNEDGFRIYRSSDGTSYTRVATVGANVKTYNNGGLAGNRKYWFKVAAYNSAGNSAYSNVASDTTAPQAPSNLTATAGTGSNWHKISLAWTDNSNSEVGFKIERATASGGPFTQIATNSASDTTYTDSNLAANTTYYYRVRSYNANGNSLYSNTANSPTGNQPPVLSAIANKTVQVGNLLSFSASATDPNQVVTTTTWQNFQSYGHNSKNDTILFRKPSHSSTTSQFQDTSTNYTLIRTNHPTGNGSTKVLKAGWGFKTGFQNYWVRLSTANTATNPNPAIALDQVVRFKVYSNKDIKLGLGVRETGTTAAYGANGGTTGDIEWVGVTNVVSGNPIPSRLVTKTNWTTVSFNIPFLEQRAFTGDGAVPQSGAKGVLEHLIIKGEGGTGAYTVFFDDFAVVAQNTLVYTLVGTVPSGASIERRTGKFKWTPSSSQGGNHRITVRATDQLGAWDEKSFTVTVTGSGNNPPVLAAVGNKTVKEGTLLTFTATATDPDAGQALTFSLDSGAPAGASINASSGVFNWTPTEAQGPGSYPITIRVTDNGSPASNDWETITVTVTEVNTAPVLAVIADQVANEQQVFTLTASASDTDIPANTLTYSLLSGPGGMTINAGTGLITWTPSEDDGPDVHQVTVRVTDNGSPKLSSERSFNITVNEVNRAPTLLLGTTIVTGIPITDFETHPDGSYNGVVMFRQPSFSSATSGFLDASPNLTSVTEDFPEGVGGARALKASFSFKSGMTNPWLRLTTFSTSSGNLIPNPTISFTNTLRFSIYSDRSIKVGLGVRETGTTAAIGANGGTSGTIEWVGATAVGTSPNPSRVVDPTNWVTLEFNLPSETVTAYPGSGNGALSSATSKGVLEHLAIVPNDGPGTYNIYLDEFEVMMPTTNLVVDTGKTIVLYNSATDPDQPENALTFSLEPNAPEGAVIDSKTGTFEWTPTAAQSPSTNTFGIRVTDDGEPALSDVKNITIRVNAVNTAPRLVYFYREFFVTPGELFEYQASAEDDDQPGDTLTYSLVGGPPSGASIDSQTGMLTWTPSSANGTNYITIRVTDNGQPPLYDELTLIVVVSPPNNAPSLSLTVARATEPVVNFETFTNGTPNEQVLFKKPANSATTSAYIDTAATNYTTVTASFPAGNSRAGAKVLRAEWTFKSGMIDYWVRLTTANTTFLPNPTINAGARLKFDVYTSKALKVGVGIRETGTSAENGANGGTTGAIEYVGCSGKSGTTPIPVRTVSANAWTTLEFDLPNEPCETLTGNSILAAGQQVLEHLILKGEGGTGVYTVYLDNFEVVTTASLPGTIAMKSGSALTFTAIGSDPDSHPISYGIEEGAPPEATIDSITGAFAWVPTTAYNGTTNEITVYVEDAPSGGYQTKRDYQTVTVIVNPDALGPQSADGVGEVSPGEIISVEWNALPGATYQVQYKESLDGDWINIGELITATQFVESVLLENDDNARFYRIVEISGGAVDE